MDSKINLCNSCAFKHKFPECLKGDVTFGNGIGNDNIISCQYFRKSGESSLKIFLLTMAFRFMRWYIEKLIRTGFLPTDRSRKFFSINFLPANSQIMCNGEQVVLIIEGLHFRRKK